LGKVQNEIVFLARLALFYHSIKKTFTLHNQDHFFLHPNTNMSEATTEVVVDTLIEESKEETPELSNDEPIEAIEVPVKKKRAPRKKTILKTADPNVEIEVKSRTPGPRKKRLIVYKEDIPEAPIVIVEKTRKRGRPKKQLETVIESEEIQRIPTPPKRQPTMRELKKQELDLRFQELQQAANRPLRQTKLGKVDKRCVGDRTEAQIAASRRLVELNKARAEERKKQDAQNAAKEVITQLSSRKTSAPKQPEAVQMQRPLTNAELWV
jgi:hypothetical protein